MSVAPASSPYTKDHPFLATVTENRRLTKPGSQKDTRHFVVNLAGSGLTYEPGASLGVSPSNDPVLVDEVIRLLGVPGDTSVVLPRAAQPVALRDALATECSLALPNRKMIELLAGRATAADERARLERLLAADAKDELAGFLRDREHVDLLAEFSSARISAQEFVDQLRRLVPRLYSIASSLRRHPDEAHLTVAVVRYESNTRHRLGVCSTFLAERVEVGRTRVPVFLTHSHFGLPEDDASDLIMVGPGTGVAPFRAFLEERDARRASGRNWLFFGEQRRATDFLYEEDFVAWQRSGLLHRLDTAFSRDQPQKIYVQDRMREQGAELWRWLQGGAYFHVCGDAKRMAKDVDHALHEIVAEHGHMDTAQAAEYVKLLRKEKRYQRDVY